MSGDAHIGVERSEFSQRFAELSRREGGREAAFLKQAAALSNEYRNAVLDNQDLDKMRELLPSWKFSVLGEGTERSTIARCLSLVTVEQNDRYSTYSIENDREVLVSRNNLVVLTRHALRGSDVSCVFELERIEVGDQPVIFTPRRTAPVSIEPAPQVKPRKLKPKPVIKSTPKSEPEVSPEPLPFLVNDKERQLVRLIPLAIPDIAEQIGETPEQVEARVQEIQTRNELDERKLLDKASDEGLIDLSLLNEK